MAVCIDEEGNIEYNMCLLLLTGTTAATCASICIRTANTTTQQTLCSVSEHYIMQTFMIEDKTERIGTYCYVCNTGYVRRNGSTVLRLNCIHITKISDIKLNCYVDSGKRGYMFIGYRIHIEMRGHF
jgi:hypothetical protein